MNQIQSLHRFIHDAIRLPDEDFEQAIKLDNTNVNCMDEERFEEMEIIPFPDWDKF